MRTISLVNRLKWSFSGNMNPHALVLGDVDNDGENEFVIGNLSGDLAIFKGECANGLPTYVCRGLGTITCLAIGDIRNWGRNSVVCINAEGQAHVLDIPRHPAGATMDHLGHHLSAEEYLKHGRRTSETSSIQAFRRTMMAQGAGLDEGFRSDKQSIYNLQKPSLTLNVPVNVNKVLIADIDGDSLNELILARTDRILHAFQLQTAASELLKAIDTPSSSSATNSVQGHGSTSLHSSFTGLSSGKDKPKLITTSKSPMSDPKEKTNVLRKSMAWSKSSRSKDVKETDNLARKSSQTLDEKAHLLDKDVWIFDGQITSLSIATHPERPNEPILLVAQPGNTFTIIDCHGNRYNRDFTPQYTPRTFYGRHQKPSYYGSQPGTPDQTKEMPTPKANNATTTTTTTTTPPVNVEKPKTTSNKDEEDDMSTTPKASVANQGPLSNLRKATQTIRTFLQRNSSTKDVPVQVETDVEADNIIVNCEGKIQDVAGEDINRSSYVVQNWPDVDGDDIMGEDNGAVATEIVIGKRLALHSDGEEDNEDNEEGTHVGMLSMDGKFSIYDLSTREISERNLFITHKLFSLATLDISKSALLSPSPPTAQSSIRQLSAFQTPSSSPQLRFPSPPVAPEQPYPSGGPTPHSNTGSPAYSPTSKLSRVPTDTSEYDKQEQHHHPTSKPSPQHHQQLDEDVGQHQQQHPEVSGVDNISLSSANHSNTEPSSSRRSSYTTTGWSDEDIEYNEEEEETQAELFVACAWNGVTYLIDWSQRVEEQGGDSKVKFQLVKFAFEGRSYAVAPGHNVPCLFYVDFEDQIYVYYDVRVSPGPVTGFIDTIDDDVEEALERIVGIESSISALNAPNKKPTQEHQQQQDSDLDEVVDLGDGWRGIVDGDVKYDAGKGGDDDDDQESHDVDLADFIHECLYGFEDMKEKLENQALLIEKKRLKHHFPSGVDMRRLSDLNITIEPPLHEREDEELKMNDGDDRSSQASSTSTAEHNWTSSGPIVFSQSDHLHSQQQSPSV
ncbi:hypothetical protein O0I10_008221 [Lichtheimia ornata]|uniref:Uncharacterized protein n=1 Tax=Lichtheimia ornata TaxID=688661 RepID=A0AAD7XVI5_9FUNG|nr:uncharacterized protein O0I10_008221 [Lichtheimia ornata]KAJ8656000.1 hypothetical protein O0I10_008221 [Lichtheimia ornata]